MAGVAQWWQNWGQWGAIALIAGCFNLLQAFKGLNQKFQDYPFLNLWLQPGFWFWLLLQTAIPGVACWFLLDLSAKPPVGIDLLIRSGAWGLAFAAIINTNIESGFLVIDPRPLWDPLVNLSLALIRLRQGSRRTKFWSDLKKELEHPNFDNGIAHILNYLTDEINSTIQQPVERDNLKQRIEQAGRSQTSPSERAEAIQSLMKEIVSRQDYPALLKDAGFSKGFLIQYFPRQVKASPTK